MVSSNNHGSYREKNGSTNYPSAFLKFLGRLFLFFWNFPLIQFGKIVSVYGAILNFIGHSFLQIPLNYEYTAALGLIYYLIFFEIPLLWRPERPTKLRAVAKKIQPSTTKERGREFVETERNEEGG